MLARMHDDAPVDAPRDELLELLYEALDQYGAGRTDLSAFVHDVDSLIVELTLLSDPGWIVSMRNQWTVLAAVLVEQRRGGAWVPSPTGCDRIAGATQGLRFLAEVRSVARSGPRASPTRRPVGSCDGGRAAPASPYRRSGRSA